MFHASNLFHAQWDTQCDVCRAPAFPRAPRCVRALCALLPPVLAPSRPEILAPCPAVKSLHHLTPQGVGCLHREAGVGLVLIGTEKVVCLLHAARPTPVGTWLLRDGCDKLEGRRQLTARVAAAVCLSMAMGGGGLRGLLLLLCDSWYRRPSWSCPNTSGSQAASWGPQTLQNLAKVPARGTP